MGRARLRPGGAVVLVALVGMSASWPDGARPQRSLTDSFSGQRLSAPRTGGLLGLAEDGNERASTAAGLSLGPTRGPGWAPEPMLAPGPRPTPGAQCRLGGGKSGRRAAWVLATTGALIATDRNSMQALSSAFAGDTDDALLSAIESFGAEGGVASVAGLYAFGDRYDKQTAQIASRALGRTVVQTEVLKTLTGRDRPRVAGARGAFHGPAGGDDAESFPSGHTGIAFTLATVYGKRYPKWKWPLYGLAASVGWARMRHEAHFPSDVFVGAAIGIRNGRREIKRAKRSRAAAPAPLVAARESLMP
ncbi:MAG: phosphatase PAP2 family protein [Armatimonadota bacterium]